MSALPHVLTTGQHKDSQAAQGPQDPSDLSAQTWMGALNSARRHMKQDRVSVVGGSLAYRWFLSLFPLIMALLGISALLHLPQHLVVRLIHGVSTALPSGAAAVLTGAISQGQKRAAGALATVVAASVVALWSATSGMVIVQEGLDMAYEVPGDRAFIKKRLVAIPMLLAAIVLGGLSSGLVIFGGHLGGAVSSILPFGGAVFSIVWAVVRWVLALVLVGLLFSVLYFLGPNRESPRWTWVSPGAVVGTGLWALASLAFSYYTSVSGSYGKSYGAFAGVALLIFWLYLTAMAVLAGGEVNAAFERKAGDQGSHSGS